MFVRREIAAVLTGSMTVLRIITALYVPLLVDDLALLAASAMRLLFAWSSACRCCGFDARRASSSADPQPTGCLPTLHLILQPMDGAIALFKGLSSSVARTAARRLAPVIG